MIRERRALCERRAVSMGIVEESLIGRGEVAVGGSEIEGIGSSPCQHAAIIKEVVADVWCPPLQKNN